MKRIILVILLFFCGAVYAAPAHRDDLTDVTKQIQSVQRILKQEHQQQIDLQQQLKITETLLQTLNQDIIQLNQSQHDEQQKLMQLKKQFQRDQTKLTTQQTSLANQIRAAYQLRNINEFKILLNQEDANTLSRHLGLYRYLAQNRIKNISSIQQNLSSLTETMQSIEQHQNKLQQLLQVKKQRQQNQLLTKTLREKLITQLNLKMQNKEQQLSWLVANQKALQDTVNQLPTPTIFTSNQPFTEQRGKLPWPVIGSIAKNFGSLLDVGDQHLTGVVIKAPFGTPVHAISAGKVVFADWLRGFGLLVIINHGNGYMSLYARNQMLYVKVGDQIKSGTTIATIGNTGGYQMSSLYFEIRQNGIPVNPNLWCRYT